ncbi:stomatin-like protein 2, mitochondrial [Asparagus officinalis]|uniref:stomatin-like protein 2, mitochondrial n=1 Tax=Asparagus officinalis TaxID=4686 RepID=UPI00098E8088|nr:stomatin-like protein 2, mitochondrial [Asparagus officinalis]
MQLGLKERAKLNEKIVSVINDAASGWGVECIRYEIMDVTPPPRVLTAMKMQVEAERKKRAQILEAEGEKESHIKRAEGNKQSAILTAEGEKESQILATQGVYLLTEVLVIGEFSIPGYNEAFWKELDGVKQIWKNRKELK